MDSTKRGFNQKNCKQIERDIFKFKKSIHSKMKYHNEVFKWIIIFKILNLLIEYFEF